MAIASIELQMKCICFVIQDAFLDSMVIHLYLCATTNLYVCVHARMFFVDGFDVKMLVLIEIAHICFLSCRI